MRERALVAVLFAGVSLTFDGGAGWDMERRF
jgi:hypothetical protein